MLAMTYVTVVLFLYESAARAECSASPCSSASVGMADSVWIRPSRSFGEIVWQKEVVANASPPAETETFVASFPASPGRRMPPAEGSDNPMLGGDSYRAGLYTGPPPPSCPVPGYRQLDLGWLNLQTPQAEPIRVVASGESDQSEYRATLPRGTMRPGRFRVSTAGGSGVAPFETDIQIGSDIQITSQFPPGFELRGDPRLTVTWTGGEPGTVVRVRLIAKGAFQDAYFGGASAGYRGPSKFPSRRKSSPAAAAGAFRRP